MSNVAGLYADGSPVGLEVGLVDVLNQILLPPLVVVRVGHQLAADSVVEGEEEVGEDSEMVEVTAVEDLVVDEGLTTEVVAEEGEVMVAAGEEEEEVDSEGSEAEAEAALGEEADLALATMDTAAEVALQEDLAVADTG